MRRRHDSPATLQPAAQVPKPPVPESAGSAADGGTVSGRAAGEVTAGGSAQTVTDPDGLEREVTVSRLFDLHYASMLRLAALLGADDPENIVAEAYYQIYRKWRKLRDTEAAEAYLRSTVCNLTRMRIRHLQVVRRHAETPPADFVASAESSALLRADQRVLIGALQQLPARQREALVLRHWLGLKESEIAAAMGISAGSVKTHTSRGIAALTQVMEARR
ncbi:sigma-70 family RNA polymerase sigma factor [Streptomyces sp. HNM0663]|uniref:Sigma-70 family RNA polymerase sigma factor n=1 Tax=Streptomyces chengmaiensis TaxID=3040919 RepID=A0ABT6HR57_9ACTN|nr:sigma-70 family RNA polymerase sigma factor [Streptomyces chengmaiensis]MDH2391200.1 sigma-70 family RNA polymerase sigma factor [Streptomyces chengmaiensis]